MKKSSSPARTLVFAEGHQSLIQSDPEFTIPTIAATGGMTISQADRHCPDLVTLEISLKNRAG